MLFLVIEIAFNWSLNLTGDVGSLGSKPFIDRKSSLTHLVFIPDLKNIITSRYYHTSAKYSGCEVLRGGFTLKCPGDREKCRPIAAASKS